MRTRCKMVCSSVEKVQTTVWDGNTPRPEEAYSSSFYPVTDGSEENKKFFASTPGGSLTLTTVRGDHFVRGKTYYLDFTEAPAEAHVG